DRARLYLLLERDSEVLPDIAKALSSEKLSLNERIRAVVTRIMAEARLGMNEDVLKDLDCFSELNKDRMPIKEESDKYIIIRNAPDADCYWNIITNYYIRAGICNSKDDIQRTSSGICIIKKAEKNEAGNYQNRNCKDCEKID